tara:strand:+ start:916 stop:1164 length:249 start_codon:yes stop_codon:yes gene_type:complete
MKLSIKHYWEPTPKKLRKIGDAILACAGVVGGGGILAYDQLKDLYTSKELKMLIGIALVAGIAGKFLTNFFTDDIKKEKISE